MEVKIDVAFCAMVNEEGFQILFSKAKNPFKKWRRNHNFTPKVP